MKQKLFFSLILALALAIFGCQASESKAEKKEPTAKSGKVSEKDSKEKQPERKISKEKPEDYEKETESSNKTVKGDKITTIYTTLDEKKCKTVDSDERDEWVVQECPGVAGYKLQVTEGDLRQTINVIAPSGGKYQLDFQRNVSPAFSYFGKTAEWRVKKVDGKTRPIALIVRFNASEDPENSEKVTSYLVVTKFEGEFVCITDVVKPVKNANVKARKLADSSAGKPCLKGNS